MSPRERHQKVIDTLSAWVLRGQMAKARALELEAEVTEGYPDGSNDVAGAVLHQIAKDEGIGIQGTV